jgi:hypothetical protein
VRPARRFKYLATIVNLVEARISVGLQNAAEACQILLRMLTFAIGAKSEPVADPSDGKIRRMGDRIEAPSEKRERLCRIAFLSLCRCWLPLSKKVTPPST